MKPLHWTTLVQSLKHGRCILVVGPEVGVDSSEFVPAGSSEPRLPNPLIFADALRINLENQLRENTDNPPTAESIQSAESLAAIAQQCEDTYRRGDHVRSQACDYYGSLPLKPSKDHEALASLPIPLIVSISQDLFLSDALTRAGKAHRDYSYNLRGDGRENADFPHPTLSNPVMYHLFGTFQDPQSLVLSENDLLDFLARLTSKQLPSSLLHQFQSDNVSLLFVGCAIRFWYQRVLLKALIRSMSAPSRASNAVAVEPLFQTIPEPDRTQTILYYQRGTCVEVIDDGDISRFVSQLLEKLDKAGGVVKETTSVTAPQVKVFVSYVRENQQIAVAIAGALKEEGLTPWLDLNDLGFGQQWKVTIEEALEAADFVLVLVTPELLAKEVGFVNAEITAALAEAKKYRDTPFVIPLISDRLRSDERIPPLRALHETLLHEASLRADIGVLASQLRRHVERRHKKQ